MNLAPVNNEDNAESVPLIRAEGITSAERYLKQLCDHTFLSLWSYPGLFRDQGVAEQGIGKEICDLLVVFENHVIIFSDKDCQFPSTGDIKTDWNRWFKKAVYKSAKQAWGAVRWIKSNPNRIFIDQKCSQPFPLKLPDPEEASYHIVVVAHGCEERCREEIGGSDSLVVNTKAIGRDHYITDSNNGVPFEIGDIDPSKEFVHILTDTSLDIVLRTVDTIFDFTSYLKKKEAFLRCGKPILAASEQDLLAFYLKDINDEGVHDFIVPSNAQGICITEGQWDNFQQRPERIEQIEVNKISYAWDALIEAFNEHILADTQYYTTQRGVEYSEKIMRYLAREHRTRRRTLAKAYLEVIEKGVQSDRFTRYVVSMDSRDTFYALLSLKMPDSVTYEKYREVRFYILGACCMRLKLKFPNAKNIVGIATEPGIKNKSRSEDATYYDVREWSAEDEEEATERSKILDYQIEQSGIYHVREDEYPQIVRTDQRTENRSMELPKNPRNKPCPCGSGKKYKRCHGKP